MIKLNVWLTFSFGGIICAGEIIVASPDPQGRLQGQFRYSQEYLNHRNAFALDPVHLPLRPELFNANRPYSGVHAVFEDSLPDDWGRRILTRRYNLSRTEQRVPQLLARLGGQSMAALSYSEDTVIPVKSQSATEHQLETLQRLAHEFEEDATAIDDEMALLFQAGSSPGGARPKALIYTDKQSFLAKFASIHDQFDVVALEAATMTLARLAGVDVAPVQLVSCGTGRVLLVERFDLNNAGGRNHVLSMQTLLGADGYYNAGYSDMADILRRVSDDPGHDLLKLFKQLVFNVMIGNTDDHLKNFCMLYDGENWKLSPAYDLVPNIGLNREHILRIGYGNIIPTMEILLNEAKMFGIKHKIQAKEIVMSIHSVVSTWNKMFCKFNIPEQDIKRIGRDIRNRIIHLSCK